MKLREYQQAMVEWVLTHPRCALWAPMGAGKTLAVLSAIAALRLLEDTGPVLVLAPKRVARGTWPAEAAKFPELGLTVQAVGGTPTQRARQLAQNADIYSMNYENVPWLAEYYGEAWPFRVVVADESTKLKGFRTRQGTKRSKALGRLAHSKIDRIVLLTGTPAPNGLIDLWGQQWFIDKGERLGATFTSFTDRWFRPGWGGFSHEPLPNAQQEIQQRLRDCCLAVDLPFKPDAPVVTDILVDIPPDARRVYRDLERQMFAEIMNGSGEITAMTAAVLSSKCQQVAAGAVYDSDKVAHALHDAKLEALDSVIEEAAGAPVLVAYVFKSDLARLRARYPHARELDDNKTTVEDWNAGRIPLLLVHPKSAGHGLNLQYGGNIVAWYNMTWSLEEYEQTVERVGPLRQWQSGLNRPCLVYRILARDTIDEDIRTRIESKCTIQQAILDAMKRRGEKRNAP